MLQHLFFVWEFCKKPLIPNLWTGYGLMPTAVQVGFVVSTYRVPRSRQAVSMVAPASGGRPGSRRTSAPSWHSSWGFVGGCRWSAWQPEDFFGVKTIKNGGVFLKKPWVFFLLKWSFLGVEIWGYYRLRKHWISWVVEIFHWELDG